LLEVEGARAPVPHSWRRHWLTIRAIIFRTPYFRWSYCLCN